jgi:hypothetical protein
MISTSYFIADRLPGSVPAGVNRLQIALLKMSLDGTGSRELQCTRTR